MADLRLDRAIALLSATTRTGNAQLPKLDPSQIKQLRAYLETLLLWRERIALISTADPVRLVEHHVLDSLYVAPQLDGCKAFADIGSGAGLPGVPLAIALPATRAVLVESRRKKANFLRAVRRSAQLHNVEVVESRAEDVTQRSFDAVTSRALGAVDAFLRLSLGLLRPAGVAIAMRGPEGAREAVTHSAFGPPRVVSYALADSRQRVLLIYERR